MRLWQSINVGAWILGNFKAVDEVREAVKGVRVWGNEIETLRNKFLKLHIALHDSTGKNAVIEFLNGEAVFQDNPLGILTNDPPLKEQLANLEKYNGLSPSSAKMILEMAC